MLYFWRADGRLLALAVSVGSELGRETGMVHNVKKTTTNTFIQCTDIWKMYQYRRIICTHPETRVANNYF